MVELLASVLPDFSIARRSVALALTRRGVGRSSLHRVLPIRPLFRGLAAIERLLGGCTMRSKVPNVVRYWPRLSRRCYCSELSKRGGSPSTDLSAFPHGSQPVVAAFAAVRAHSIGSLARVNAAGLGFRPP